MEAIDIDIASAATTALQRTQSQRRKISANRKLNWLITAQVSIVLHMYSASSLPVIANVRMQIQFDTFRDQSQMRSMSKFVSKNKNKKIWLYG